jgi:hypothetical protein
MAELTPAASCCSPAHQAVCCEPEEKAGCCTPASSDCGCSAAGEHPDAEDPSASGPRDLRHDS